MTKKLAQEIIYLACPYTHESAQIREQRFWAASKAAAELIRQGKIVLSPISMTHPIDVILSGGHETMGSDFWVKFDEAFMEMCDEIIILRLEGWEESSGIARERRFFAERGRRISFIDPQD